MAKEKGADQTEKPTPKRLQDARKEGQVHKSQDLSKTFSLLVWIGLIASLVPYLVEHIIAVFDLIFDAIAHPASRNLRELLLQAGRILMMGLLPFLLVAMVAGFIIEFIQVGPLLAMKRVSPKLEHLNPAEGIKRMFSRQNLVEVLKAFIKSVVLIVIILLVARSFLAEVVELPKTSSPLLVFGFYHSALVAIGVGLISCFFLIAALDVAYQKFEFTKNLMMSQRDIKQEYKDSEGDPMMKGQRRELHQEWSQQNQMSAARQANVLIVNPTHIAVALQYTPEVTDLPLLVAKGEGPVARQIRKAAEEAGVPVLQNMALARGLFNDIALESFITPDFFEPVAEVLRWAEEVRQSRMSESQTPY
jgi:type III secretion protein U